MATASLAVPKSVMKTMVGRVVEGVWGAAGDSFGAGCCWQAEQKRTRVSTESASRRVRKVNSPKKRYGNGPKFDGLVPQADKYT
jgi:hypothetical protein